MRERHASEFMAPYFVERAATLTSGPSRARRERRSRIAAMAAAFAVLGVHRWMHTVEDTLQRVDATLVLPVLRAHQKTIELIVEQSRTGA